MSLLTDLNAVAPASWKRWLYARLGIAEGVHEWLCDVGLCPCGVDLDAFPADALLPAELPVAA